tara:strand:+ start:219 stop:1214 length:996 start_codon:yes stop_codon:yes gene_type:complete
LLATLKKLKLRILASLFFVLPILSFSSLASIEPKNYQKYHEQINKAENFIGEEEFPEALKVYNEIFNSFDFVFVKDYKIAAQLALFLKDKKTALEIIKKGIAGGWDIKSLNKNQYLSKLQDDPLWEGNKEAYFELRKKYEDRINHGLRSEVHEMFKMDQKKARGALFRIGDQAKEKYAMKKFAPHSEIQLKKFIKILEDQGYPGEQLIGNNFWMSTILSHHNSISKDYVIRDSLYNFIKPKLIEAIWKGQISPYEFAMIDDWYLSVSSGGIQTGYGFLNPPLSSQLAETDSLRKRIGLRSIELRNKLVDVENKTGMNFYLPDWIEGKINIE